MDKLRHSGVSKVLVNIISDLHKSTTRDYYLRMTGDKPEYMKVAKKYQYEYWDGDRVYGYGGFVDDGRWREVARRLIEHYKLDNRSRVLDIGCGKGFLAWEISSLTGCQVDGGDISDYALEHCVLRNKFKFDAGTDRIDKDYDLIISLATLHNLETEGLKHALQEISAHSKDSYITLDSYRDERELYNLQCWALTAQQFHTPKDWEFLFDEFGYLGDWEYLFFE